MPSSVTPLSARSQTLTTVLFWLIVVMGLSPLVEFMILRWPVRFGEVPWRYDTFAMFLSNGPVLVILLGILTMFGVLIGDRVVVRSASIALAAMAIVTLVVVPLYALDYFQVGRLVSQDKKRAFKLEAIRMVLVAGFLILGAAWAAYRGWLASEPPDVAARRAKGEGLVVGQPKPSRPPT